MSARVLRHEDWVELCSTGHLENPLLTAFRALEFGPCVLCGTLTEGSDCELGHSTAVVKEEELVGLVCWGCAARLGDDDILAGGAARRVSNFVRLEVACEIINRLVPNAAHLVETLDDIGHHWLADILLGKEGERSHPEFLNVETVCAIVTLDEKRRFSELIPRDLDEVLALADEVEEADLRFLGKVLDDAVRGCAR